MLPHRSHLDNHYDHDYFLIAPLFGVLGAASSIVFTVMGAAYGTAKCMIGVAAVAPKKPDFVLKAMVPMVMASVIAIYGLVVAVIIINNIEKVPNFTLYRAFICLGAGLSVGLCGMMGGVAIGVMGDTGVQSSAVQPQMYTTVVLITGFAMVAGMYGLVVALVQGAKR